MTITVGRNLSFARNPVTVTKEVTMEQGIELCKELYAELSTIGFFPALTGGSIYKEGNRKDIDIVIFRHRQMIEKFEMTDIFTNLENIGITDIRHFGFVTKCVWKGCDVDLFNPETIIKTYEDYKDMKTGAGY
tara:strand:- start:1106 stop:1504 length:399 start_codon:yes stop_codon:yes gene_type:complete